jgi:tRNA threonylcarbamoyl adenosine modification protein YeaZ
VLILAIDTSSATTTVAIARGDFADVGPGQHLVAGRLTAVLAEESELAPNRHAEVLAPLVERALHAAGASRKDISSVAVGVGPGPFTGLRVGVVSALATADALGVPVRGVCSLDVIAHHDERPWPDGFAVLSDARRKEVYWATYRDGRRVQGPSVDTPAAVAEQLPPGSTVVGAGAEIYRDRFVGFFVEPRWPFPSAADLAELSMRLEWQVPVEPMYRRRPDARPPGPPKRVTPA